MYPLSEYLRPWKLFTLAIGMAWLIWGVFYYQFEDWDIPISLMMGIMAYLFAPWSVSVFVERRWNLAPVALFLAWLTIDGVYVGYNGLMGHWYPRLENFYASTCLFLLCGFGWMYRGDLRSLFLQIRKVLGHRTID
jgi:hypothetical protein